MTEVKDPAFLFYSAQFMQMVSDLTMEERGMFITLLCAQHQHGELKEKTIRLLVGNPSDDLMDKFCKTENGNMVNEWLSSLVEKRKFYTDSRRQNGQKGGRPAKNQENNEENNQNKTISYSYDKPTNNLPVNVNVNVNKDINYKGVQGEKFSGVENLIPDPNPHHTEVHDPATGQFVATKTKDVSKLVPNPKSYSKLPEEINIMLMQLEWKLETLEMCYHAWCAKCEADPDLRPMNHKEAKASFKKFAWYFKANHPNLDKNKSINGSAIKPKVTTVYH